MPKLPSKLSFWLLLKYPWAPLRKFFQKCSSFDQIKPNFLWFHWPHFLDWRLWAPDLFFRKYLLKNVLIWKIRSSASIHDQGHPEWRSTFHHWPTNMENLKLNCIFTLLSTVKYLREVWQLTFLIKNFISLGKIGAIITTDSFGFVNLKLKLKNYCTEVLNVVKILLTDVLSLRRVKIELIVTFMHQLIGTYNSLLQLKEFFR